MSSRGRFEHVRPEDLRDQATPERIERIWDRLREDLAPRKTRAARTLWWAPAAAICLFGAGVFVGAQWFAAEPPPDAKLIAEPSPAWEPAAVPPSVTAPQETPKLKQRERRPQKVQPPSQPPPGPSAELVPMEVEPLPPVVSGPPAWQTLADEGLYAEAAAAIEQQGGFDQVLRDATAEQLMTFVDVARWTKQGDRAIAALERVVSLHGSDPNAPVAAWMLGNELLKAGDPNRAAQAFAMYRALSPQGDFAQDALARQFEVAADQGNLEDARRLAEQYERDFPEGTRRDDIRARLEELTQAASAVSAPPAGGAPGSGGAR
jgi:TolA-binding protein